MVEMDLEVKAMGEVAAAIDGLDDDARKRVLQWAGARYGVSLTATGGSRGAVDTPEPEWQHRVPDARDVPREDPVYEDFVDLFDAVDPGSDVEKALAGAYWLQVIQRSPSWRALNVNNLLKDTGHGIGNVTTALTSLQSRKPALVRQMAKSGKSQQARKTYKLTTSGIAYVRNKLGLGSSVPAALADNGDPES
ncbi:hypothetical protein AB0J40_21710 [Amycolatopsis sp. NPDC049691]|uniref:hypothetical protein n=1 Tax=Amycolatopsis sp. NPDC049691 TaxID=3155155 RepID=UPI0034378DCE